MPVRVIACYVLGLYHGSPDARPFRGLPSLAAKLRDAEPEIIDRVRVPIESPAFAA